MTNHHRERIAALRHRLPVGMGRAAALAPSGKAAGNSTWRRRRLRVHRAHPGGRLAGGQAMVEVLVVTLVVVAGFWGLGWTEGGNGVVTLLLEALRDWHQRFAAALALPV